MVKEAEPVETKPEPVKIVEAPKQEESKAEAPKAKAQPVKAADEV